MCGHLKTCFYCKRNGLNFITAEFECYLQWCVVINVIIILDCVYHLRFFKDKFLVTGLSLLFWAQESRLTLLKGAKRIGNPCPIN
jgi:hypothetical protein